MSEPVIQVSSGFSPTFWATASTGIVAFFGLIGVWVRQRGPWRKNEIAAEEKMREELMHQLVARDQRIDKLEKQIDHERAVSASERSLMEHQIKGLEQLLQTTFELLRVVAPERLPEIIERLTVAWEKHKERVAMEKGEVMAAREATP